MAFSTDDIARLIGAIVRDPGDEKVGRIVGLYLDAEGLPSWATVRTGFFGPESFVPLDGADLTGKDVHVPYAAATVAGAPRIDPREELGADDSDALHAYYDGHGRTPGPVTRGDDDARTATSEPGGMLRSEERLLVDTERVERGRARLRRHVVAEQRTVTVPVTREVASLVREPIRDPDAGGAATRRELTEEVHEIVLHGDVVTTQRIVVPVERVRLRTERIVDEQQVTADLRSEQIDSVESDGTAAR